MDCLGARTVVFGSLVPRLRAKKTPIGWESASLYRHHLIIASSIIIIREVLSSVYLYHYYLLTT